MASGVKEANEPRLYEYALGTGEISTAKDLYDYNQGYIGGSLGFELATAGAGKGILSQGQKLLGLGDNAVSTSAKPISGSAGAAANSNIEKWVPDADGNFVPVYKKNLSFTGKEADNHFTKHGHELASAFNKKSYNLDNYLKDANHVIQNGTYVPELNGYVKLIGGEGSAKYAFVGVKNGGKDISTFHIKTVKQLEKIAPSLGLKK